MAPIGAGKEGVRCLKASITMPDGRKEEFELPYGSMKRILLGVGETAEAVLEPAGAFDVGAGKGKHLRVSLKGGVVGVIVDCRGRQPFALPKEPQERINKLIEWCGALDVYPEAFRSMGKPAASAAR